MKDRGSMINGGQWDSGWQKPKGHRKELKEMRLMNCSFWGDLHSCYATHRKDAFCSQAGEWNTKGPPLSIIIMANIY